MIVVEHTRACMDVMLTCAGQEQEAEIHLYFFDRPSLRYGFFGEILKRRFRLGTDRKWALGYNLQHKIRQHYAFALAPHPIDLGHFHVCQRTSTEHSTRLTAASSPNHDSDDRMREMFT